MSEPSFNLSPSQHLRGQRGVECHSRRYCPLPSGVQCSSTPVQGGCMYTSLLDAGELTPHVYACADGACERLRRAMESDCWSQVVTPSPSPYLSIPWCSRCSACGFDVSALLLSRRGVNLPTTVCGGLTRSVPCCRLERCPHNIFIRSGRLYAHPVVRVSGIPPCPGK